MLIRITEKNIDKLDSKKYNFYAYHVSSGTKITKRDIKKGFSLGFKRFIAVRKKI